MIYKFSLEDYVLGFLGAGILIAIITIWCIVLLKKGNKEFDKILAKIPKEDMDKLIETGFETYPGNDKLLIGTSIISNIKQDSNKMKIEVVFYNSFFRLYSTYNVFIKMELYQQKQLKVRDFVKTLHINDKDKSLKVKEIL